MKRIVYLLLAVFVFLPALALTAFSADVELSAEFGDGFSDNAGKLAVTVKNVSKSAPADVTVSLSLPEGVSTDVTSVTFSGVEPSAQASKDFILTFEGSSVSAGTVALIIAAAVFAVIAVVCVVVMIKRRKSPPAKTALLALMLIPAALLCTRSFADAEVTKTLTVTHSGDDYEITMTATAVDSAATIEDDMSEPAPAQNGEPAQSRPLKNTRPTEANADYNTPVVGPKRIKDGAGPLGTEHVYVGTNEFMFYGEEIEYFSGNTVIDNRTVDQIASRLTDIKEKADENGIDLYLLICPNKSTVYADYVPENVNRAEDTSRTKLVSYLEENTDINITDATDALIAAREEYGDKLYYKYDTHWTQHGGYIAYRELIKTIRRDHPDTVFYASDCFDVTEYETYMKDNAYYLGYYDAYTDYGPVYSLKKGPEATLTAKRSEEQHGQYRFCYRWEDGYRDDLVYAAFESVNENSPKAYVLRDSYGIALVPFMKESFSASSFLWSYKTTFSSVTDSGANVLVIEIVERTLGDLATARLS